jgi:hypothetical protein
MAVCSFSLPEYPTEVIAAFEEAIIRVHEEPGVEVYALHEGSDRLMMIEKTSLGAGTVGASCEGPSRQPAGRFGGQPEPRPRPPGPDAASNCRRAKGAL